MNRRRILIVDDEKGFTNMLSLNLESTGYYEVIEINDPKEALTAAISCKPDLILLDIIMPDKEGPDVYNELRSSKAVSNIPIIFLTATVTKKEVEENQGRIGGHCFVAKPSSLADLLDSIEKNISSQN